MICLDFSENSIESAAGKIPSCIEWLKFETTEREKLLKLFATDITFLPETIAGLGWIGIDADTGGQLEDDDEALLAAMLKERGVLQLLASSQRDLRRPKGDSVLGARLLEPTTHDLACLRLGNWAKSNWIDVLTPLSLMWLGWEELFLFTWPLRFALVQLSEGDGHTTLVGPPDFINEFISRSNPEHWYQWEPWGLPLTREST